MKTLTNLFKRIWQFLKSLFTWAEPESTKPVVQHRTEATRSASAHHVNSYSRRPWTKDEEDYLINNYPDTKDTVLAVCLKRSYMSIAKKANKLGLKKSPGFFSVCASKDETIESKLARIMEMQNDIGEFTVNLYYNRLAPNEERCVAKYHEVLSSKVYHARSRNFTEALNRIQEYISTLQ